jgi:hypothetical protein
VGAWLTGRAREPDGFPMEVLDLAEVDLPLCDETCHPRLRDYQHDVAEAVNIRFVAPFLIEGANQP